MQRILGDTLAARAARLALIALFAAMVALAGVFTMPPLDRDEARFAQATVQMLETGDFVSIRFQDDERNKKPAGIHWLQAASVAVFSAVEAREIWAYRLPSVLGAVLAALFTYAAGARLYGPRTGLLAALLLAASPAVAGEATIAKTDAMLLASVVAAQAAFIRIFGDVVGGRRASIVWPLFFWLALGAGVLIKGPIILMVVGLTAAAMAVHRPRRDWVMALRPAMGVIILALTIGPWAFAVHDATEGRFFAEAIGGDMAAKLAGAKEGHSGPPGYYLVLLFILFWPAAALIPAGFSEAFATRKNWRSWFLLAWIIPAWIVFELVPTKLPHYTLPLYPAIAVIAARAAVEGVLARSPQLRRVGTAAYALVGLALSALIVAIPAVYDQPAVLIVPISIAVVIAFRSAFVGVAFGIGRNVMTATRGAIVLGAITAWTLLVYELPRLDRLALSPRINDAVDNAGLHPLRDGAEPAILAGYHEPSAVFLLGTRTVLAKDGGEAAERFTATGGAAIIEGREQDAFLVRLGELGASADMFAEVAGFNYSNGDDITLFLYHLRKGQG